MCPSAPILSSCCNNLRSGGSVRTSVPQTNTRGTKPQERKRRKKWSICKNVAKVSCPQADVPVGHIEVQALRKKVCKGTESPRVTSPESCKGKSKFRIVAGELRVKPQGPSAVKPVWGSEEPGFTGQLYPSGP